MFWSRIIVLFEPYVHFHNFIEVKVTEWPPFLQTCQEMCSFHYCCSTDPEFKLKTEHLFLSAPLFNMSASGYRIKCSRSSLSLDWFSVWFDLLL